MTFNVSTTPSGQKETVINGKRYAVQTDRFGEEFVVIDGKRVNLKEPLFNNYFQERLDKATEELNDAKEKASMWGKIFDFNLQGVRDNRKERIAFTKEYGTDINSMDTEQQEQYKAILEEGGEYSTSKNIALGRQLSYTNQVVSLACSKKNLLNQASIFGV